MAFHKTGRVSLLLIFWLAACSAAVPTTPAPENTAALTPQASPSAEPSATSTALPSPTRTKRPLPSATSAPTYTAIPNATATRAVAYDELKVLALDNKVGGWLLTLIVPGAARPLRLELAGSSYDCSVDAQYPDRLFCQGLSKPPFDAQMDLAFVDPQTNQVLYASKLVIPTALMVRPTQAGWAGTSCDKRGQGVSCEVECRIAPSGSPCIVATCTDDCGPYFSVHTCPDMSLDFASCTPEQWARMKALYQIP